MPTTPAIEIVAAIADRFRPAVAELDARIPLSIEFCPGDATAYRLLITPTSATARHTSGGATQSPPAPAFVVSVLTPRTAVGIIEVGQYVDRWTIEAVFPGLDRHTATVLLVLLPVLLRTGDELDVLGDLTEEAAAIVGRWDPARFAS